MKEAPGFESRVPGCNNQRITKLTFHSSEAFLILDFYPPIAYLNIRKFGTPKPPDTHEMAQ